MCEGLFASYNCTVLTEDEKNVQGLVINGRNLGDATGSFGCFDRCVAESNQTQNALGTCFRCFLIVNAGIADSAVPLRYVDSTYDWRAGS